MNFIERGNYSTSTLDPYMDTSFIFDKRYQYECPVTLQIPEALGYKIHIGSHIIFNCGVPCTDWLWEEWELKIGSVWIAVWASLCLISSLFTVLTFCIDPSRFCYPERPIIFLAGCYCITSLCHLVGLAADGRVACHNGSKLNAFVLSQGSQRVLCTCLFMLLYFSFMAACAWWVALTATWFLSAALRWGGEAVAKVSHLLHLAAWIAPALQTAVVVALGGVDGEPLSGACFTGVSNPQILRGLVIAPLGTYLVLGSLLLFIGFVALFRIRAAVRGEGERTDRLDRFMGRIGLFSLVYVVATTTVVVCYAYELSRRDKWMETWYLKLCFYGGDIPCPGVYADRMYLSPSFLKRLPSPSLTVFLTRYFMIFLMGLCTGFWVCSLKTLRVWTNIFRSFFHKLSSQTKCKKPFRTSSCSNASSPTVPPRQNCSSDKCESVPKDEPSFPLYSPYNLDRSPRIVNDFASTRGEVV